MRPSERDSFPTKQAGMSVRCPVFDKEREAKQIRIEEDDQLY